MKTKERTGQLRPSRRRMRRSHGEDVPNMPTTKAGPDVPSLDGHETERWEKYFRVALGAVIRAQTKTPNPRAIARIAKQLADAGVECADDRHRKPK